MNAYLRVVFAIFVVLVSSGIMFAQSDLATISGFVKDPSGATVPGAKVLVRNKSGVERQTSTNDNGYYSMTNMPPGLYTLDVEAPGFQKLESSDNKLDPSANLVIDATLIVGATNQTVQVSASAVSLQTESASVQEVVTREQIDSLEINGRNPIFMADLVPGTRGGTLANLSFNFSQGPSNINGARTPESLITYDGAPAVRTRSNGTSIGAADVDSTQEIQILTADYAPEYGRSSGGQIRITSKSGSQTSTAPPTNMSATPSSMPTPGNVTRCRRQRAITAPIHYNQFGYNIGGPLYIPNHFNTDKTKVFWYWGEEWVRYIFTDTNSLTVPTLKMRTGDFSELLDPNNIFYHKAVVLMDPKTGLPFPGNIIPPPGLPPPDHSQPQWAWDSQRVSFAQSDYTHQREPKLVLLAQHPQYQRKDTVAIDINLTDKQRLRFRRVYFTFWEYQPLDGGTNETPKFFDRPNQTNSIDHVWTISPTKVNEVLCSFSHDNVHIPVDQAHFLDRTTVGLNYPYIFPDGERDTQPHPYREHVCFFWT